MQRAPARFMASLIARVTDQQPARLALEE